MSNSRPGASEGEVVAAPAAVDPSGVPDLDLVLGGGLPRGSLIIIVGPPGSGKTTLANQIAFDAAHHGRRSLVLTALSEPTSKLITRLRSFRFYDDSLVGDTLQFMSLEQFLPAGLEATGDEMIAIARARRAALVVLDGFRGVRGADVDPQVARQFLYDVGTTLSVLGTTTIITSEADPRDPLFFPEQTTADVIIGLHFGLVGVRQRRAVEAVKVRAVDPLPGLHGLTLSEHGARVFPRLEALITSSPGRKSAEDAGEVGDEWDSERLPENPNANRATFGMPELDVLLGGGLTRGTSALLLGSIGTGKTLLGLHFLLAGASAGEQGVFLGFRESRRQLIEKATTFAMGQQLRAALERSGRITLQRWAPVELSPDIVANRLLEALDATGARRLVVDSVLELERAVARNGDPERVGDYMAALIEALRGRDITTLFIKEHPRVLASELDVSTGPISVLAENVLLMEQVEYRSALHRVLSVPKMRFSAHDHMLREFTITAPQGIHVLSPVESGSGVLASIARERDTERGRRGGTPASGRPRQASGGQTTAGANDVPSEESPS
ncbi:MAG: RAD55 family ATPase [Ktedonobacterales bacterium]